MEKSLQKQLTQVVNLWGDMFHQKVASEIPAAGFTIDDLEHPVSYPRNSSGKDSTIDIWAHQTHKDQHPTPPA